MARCLGVLEYLQISGPQFLGLTEKISSLMHKRPYHNFTHICDVAQAVFSLLHRSHFTIWLEPYEVATVFLATICHDLDHPGNSNNLEKNENTELHQLYADSPLEHHHASLTIKDGGILDESKLLSALEPAVQQKIKNGISELILATDMAKHGAITTQLKELLAGGDEAIAACRRDPAKKLIVLKNILKCADISNQARNKAAADFWNSAIYCEFYAEGDRDREQGRALNPLHDRSTNNISKSSVGFSGYVVKPMFQQVHTFFEKAKALDDRIDTSNTAFALENLQNNSEAFAKEAATAAAAPAAEPGAADTTETAVAAAPAASAAETE